MKTNNEKDWCFNRDFKLDSNYHDNMILCMDQLGNENRKLRWNWRATAIKECSQESYNWEVIGGW